MVIRREPPAAVCNGLLAISSAAASGLHRFPRLADLLIEAEYELGDTRTSSGIAALDDLLGSGYWPGASTLVVGPSGSGKTLMGLHFIFDGARQEEPRRDCLPAGKQDAAPAGSRRFRLVPGRAACGDDAPLTS
jgi:KaiC